MQMGAHLTPKSSNTETLHPNVNRVLPNPTPITKMCKHKRLVGQENISLDNARICSACLPGKKAPLVTCKVNKTKIDLVVDTGATITVFKKTRDLPKSKLRLKSATSHKASLYGPEWTNIQFGKQVFRFPVYEADITENLLGYDFIDAFEGIVNTKTKELELENNVRVPFKIVESQHKGDFGSGNLSYIVRANQKILLKPFVERQVSTKLETDLVADELELSDALLSMTINEPCLVPQTSEELATPSEPGEQTSTVGSELRTDGGDHALHDAISTNSTQSTNKKEMVWCATKTAATTNKEKGKKVIQPRERADIKSIWVC